ncbi:Mss4-like protein [Aspergillus pseudoustus]|uniref:Mss4-like protein n=1 Tax=Aspergillus pseudoustus TaxID=1810923 RepID=A0ABR4JPS2_9EURO
MPDGRCLCGEIQVSFTGDPALQALCHCTDCRRISGSAFSTNALIPDANFTLVRGSPKVFEKVGEESGLPIRSFFCGNCGTTCFREGGAFPGVKILKAGILQAFSEEVRPVLEGFVDRRVPWVAALEVTRGVSNWGS